MSPDKREAHIRRMMAHGRKVQDQLRTSNAEFERGCREFWDFMRTVRGLNAPQGTKQVWDHIHEGEESCRR